MTNSEIVIRSDGTFKRSITETAIEIQESLVGALSANVVRKVPNLMRLDDEKSNEPNKPPARFGCASFCAQQNDYAYWSVRIARLPLRCNCNTEDGVVVPAFDNNSLPKLELFWQPPENMILILGVAMSMGAGYYQSIDQHLIAMDTSNRMYKLPTSNLFKDLRLCSGQGGNQGKQFITALEVIQEAANQFEKSSWNSHLYGELSAEQRQWTKNLFRFKPTETGFEQLPSTAHWTKLCEKVANTKLATTVIPTSL